MTGPWKPTNGSEEACFETRFCSNCWHNSDLECGILIDFKCGPLYQPEEWIQQDSVPKCTAFKLYEKQEPETNQIKDCEGQEIFPFN